MARKQLSWQQSLNVIGAVILVVVVLSAIFTIAVVVLFYVVADRQESSGYDPWGEGQHKVTTQCGPVDGVHDRNIQVLSFKVGVMGDWKNSGGWVDIHVFFS